MTLSFSLAALTVRELAPPALIDVAAELAQLWPVIASPRAPLSRRTPLAELAWAAGYLKTLDVGSNRARREVLADRNG